MYENGILKQRDSVELMTPIDQAIFALKQRMIVCEVDKYEIFEKALADLYEKQSNGETVLVRF